MKKRAFLALLLALTLTFAPAIAQEDEETPEAAPAPKEGFDEQKAYDWLASQAANGNYGNDIAITALAGLALSEVGYQQSARKSAEWILTQKDAKNCFPKGDCKVKDTALTLMLLKSLSMPEADAVQQWLETSQVPSSTQGRWLLEIATQAAGECEITYDRSNKTFKDKIAVDKGKFPACSNSNFFDMDSCYKSGLLKSEAGLKFIVDCSALTGETPIITLVYNKDSTFYLISTVFGSVAELTVTNGCYSKTAKGSCNKEASVYAAWALSNAGSPKNVNLYLLENYDSASIFDNALMYTSFLTKDSRYLDAIKSRQSVDGSFNRDFFQTALSLLALKDSPLYTERVDKAKSWLQSKQGSEGSWGQNVRDTAMILYAAYGDAVLQPEKVEAAKKAAGTCNYDYVCDTEAGETADGCTDCAIIKREGACNEDNVCDSLDGETAENCVDCSCGDEVCDSSEDSDSCPDDCEAEKTAEESECGNGLCEDDESEDSCPDDCKAAEEGAGFGTVLLIMLIVLLVGVGGFLAYKKFAQKGAQKPKPSSPFAPNSSYAPFRRVQPQQPARPAAARTESQLQKSLDEARKLLRK